MNRRIRILFIIDKLAPGIGGTATYLTELLRGLDRDKYAPFVCALGGEATGVHIDKIRALDVEIYFWGIDKIYGFKALLFFLQATSFIKRGNFDLVSTYLFSSNVYGVFAARIAKVKIIVANKREIVTWKRWHHRIISKIANQLCQCITVNSNESKKALLSIEHVPEAKIFVIHNGIEIKNFNLPNDEQVLFLKKEIGFNETDFIIGIVSNFLPVKDHDTLFKAFVEVFKQYPNVSLLIVGGGPMENQLKRRVVELKIDDKVVFVGRQAEVKKFLAVMDVYVSTSLFEGFSNSILEAMAMAKPVIATRTGGNIDAVVEGQSGFLFFPKDYYALASKLMVFLNDRTLKQKMGQAGRKRVEENFTSEKMARNIEKLFVELLE